MDRLPPETDHLGRLLKTSDVFPLAQAKTAAIHNPERSQKAEDFLRITK
jgi:hypothetical protein